MSKVESLYGTTPAEIFQSGLENLDRIEAIAVSVLWKDDTITAGWSNAPAATVALMALALDERARKQILPEKF